MTKCVKFVHYVNYNDSFIIFMKYISTIQISKYIKPRCNNTGLLAKLEEIIGKFVYLKFESKHQVLVIKRGGGIITLTIIIIIILWYDL